MVYSEAKLKTNCNRASTCFSPFWIWNVSDVYLHWLCCRFHL